MKKIYIKTTESCQLRCKHCYIGDNRNKEGFFDETAVIDWVGKYLKDNHLPEEEVLFSFHGGEPFLCDLNKMQRVCDAFPKASFDVTTNLIYPADRIEKIGEFIKRNLCSPEDARPFIKTSWDYAIRFNSPEQEELFWNNLGTIQHQGVRVEVITCLTDVLIKDITPEMYLFLMDIHGVRYVNFERLTDNTTEEKTLIPDYTEQSAWLHECYRIWKDRFYHIEIEFFRNMMSAAHGIFTGCRNRTCMRDVITINADGTYGGCPNSSISSWYGNIKTGELNENLHGELIKCERMRHPECFTCELFKICNGDCHQLAWQNGVCPEPKELLMEIIDDVEREKKIMLSNT